ncbi:MAG: hypothetical protein ACK4N5_04105 [Myxococcales bacterium]
MTLRSTAFALALALCGACASTPAPSSDATATADRPIVPGEALVRAEEPPTPESLSEALDPGVVVVAVEPIFGKVYRVKLARAASQDALDEATTRSAVAALGKAQGILTSEPNLIEQPQGGP